MIRTETARATRPGVRADRTGPGRHVVRPALAATARAAARETQKPVADPDGRRTSLVVVDRLDALTLRPAPEGGVTLAPRLPGDPALDRRAAALAGVVVADVVRDGVRAVTLGAGPTTALVVPTARPGLRDARVALVGRVVAEVRASHVDLAVPDLWDRTAAATLVARAVADTADTVTAGSATFRLDGRDGVGTWRTFARACSPVPAAPADGRARP